MKKEIYALNNGTTNKSTDVDDFVRLIYYIQQKRKVALPQLHGIMRDPAWDIIIYLYLYRNQSNLITVTNTCIAAEVPETTGLRYLSALENRGLIYRTEEPFDKRKKYVFLADHFIRDLDQFFSKIMHSGR